MIDYRSRLQNLKDTIPTNVDVVAVSKYSSSYEISSVFDAGHTIFGENRVQDLKSKKDSLSSCNIEWHFIGNLQTNKINMLIELKPSLIHSISSLKLAYELNKRLKTKDITLKALLQINSADEDSKSGVEIKDAINIYNEINSECENIELKVVMCIGANTDDEDKIEKSFSKTYDIYSKLNAQICSMGMSMDYKIALKCGSNMIRLGSAIFK